MVQDEKRGKKGLSGDEEVEKSGIGRGKGKWRERMMKEKRWRKLERLRWINEKKKREV